VVELVDARDSKSRSARSVGSIPTARTIFPLNQVACIQVASYFGLSILTFDRTLSGIAGFSFKFDHSQTQNHKTL
jgi:hypothetical protein